MRDKNNEVEQITILDRKSMTSVRDTLIRRGALEIIQMEFHQTEKNIRPFRDNILDSEYDPQTNKKPN